MEPLLQRQVTREKRKQPLDEAESRGACALSGDIVRSDRHRDPNERSIRPVVTDGIENRINLPPVFARDHAVAALIPIEDHLTIEPLLDDEPVHLDGALRSAWRSSHRNDGSLLLDRHPAGPWKAVQGRVDRVALALARVEAHIQTHQCCVVYVGADDVLVHTELILDVSLKIRLYPSLPTTDLEWKRGERCADRRGFRTECDGQVHRCDRDTDRGHNGSADHGCTPAALGAFSGAGGASRSSRRETTNSNRKATTNTSHPEKVWKKPVAASTP